MSLSIKHLNADTTFLLTFSDDAGVGRQTSTFTILVDPWLAGSSSVWTPSFQISHHVQDPVIDSLADMPLPDLVLISQDKPDHCHEETLRTLPRDTPVNILAVPGAAKQIKSWGHFENATIRYLPPWNPKNPDTVHRITLRSRDVLFGSSGEITISYIPQRFDMTNLHNAIGITYSPPLSGAVDKTGLPIALPLSPPLTPVQSHFDTSSVPNPPMINSNLFFSSTHKRHSSQSDRPLSLLYTPHGIGIPCITPYMQSHLEPMNALPLTALFHSLNTEENPWFLGGRVASGFPGGSALVRTFGAKYWVGAHDEAKDNKGWSTALLRSRPYTVEEAQFLLDDEIEREGQRQKTKLVDMGVGKDLLISL